MEKLNKLCEKAAGHFSIICFLWQIWHRFYNTCTTSLEEKESVESQQTPLKNSNRRNCTNSVKCSLDTFLMIWVFMIIQQTLDMNISLFI